MPRPVLSILLLLVPSLPLAAQQMPPIGIIDFYGLRTLPESTVRRLGSRSPWRVAPSRFQIERSQLFRCSMTRDGVRYGSRVFPWPAKSRTAIVKPGHLLGKSGVV